MNILTQAIKIINYEEGKVISRQIMPEMGEYIEQMICYIRGNKSVREYHTQSETTEVIHAVLNIKENYSDEQKVKQNEDLIADRLLRVESNVQEQISSMGVKVQKGSLILSLVEDNNHSYFLLAKVEHTDFFDDYDYSVKTGFSKDEKKIWKTCLLDISTTHTDSLKATIYCNNMAKYWWHDFLELEEVHSDENNTRTAYKALTTVLKRSLKKEAPYDHTVIQNAINAFFSSETVFDYEEMMERIIRNYTPNDMSGQKKEQLMQDLWSLPETKHFDHRFRSVPECIKPKMRKKYPVYSNIEVTLLGEIDNLSDVIQSCEESNGRRYLRIRVDNDETFNAFKCR